MLQLEFGGGIAEPGVAVLGGQIVVVVLGGEGHREGLGGIDAHAEALGVAAHGGRLFAAALGVAAALGEAAAIDDAYPLEGAEREAAAETESLGIVLVEALADETLALGEAVAAEDADGGAQEVEALAGLAADAVVAGGGGLVDSLHDAGGSLVVVTVDLVVVGAAIVEADVGEEGSDGTAVAQTDVGPVVLGLRQLFDVAALEGTVVRHDVAAVDTARVAHGLRVAGTAIEPEVAGNGPVHGERGEEEQVGVAVLVLPDLIVEGLSVEFEGQTEGDVEVGRLVLITLAEGETVGVVPKVVAQLVVLGRRYETIEVGLDAVEVGRGADAIIEAEHVGHADAVTGIEASGNVVGVHVLRVGGLSALQQGVDVHGEGVGTMGIASGEVEVEGVLADVADGVEGVRHSELRTIEVLAHTVVAVIHGGDACALGRELSVHAVAVPVGVELQHVGHEAVLCVPVVAGLYVEVVHLRLTGHGLGGEQAAVVAQKAVAHAAALATDAVVVVGDVQTQFCVLVGLLQMVHSQDVAVVVEGALLRQAGAAGHDGARGAEGIEADAVDAGVVLREFLRHVVTRVVAFIQRHVLAALGEVHAHNLGSPERVLADNGLAVVQRSATDVPAASPLDAAAQHGVDGDRSLGRVFQLQVDGHVVGEFLALKHLHGLVVLQDLHGGHVRGVDVVGGESVAALQQVHLLDVEFLDALAVVLDAAALRHLDAGHTLQHVADDAIALLLVGSDEVVERVAVLPNLLRTDGYFFQLHILLLHAEVEPLRLVFHDFHLIADGKARGRDGHGVGLRGELQTVVSLRVGVGKAQDIARALRSHGDVSVHRLALRVEHGALDDGLLCVSRQCCEGEDGCDESFIHFYYGCFEVTEKLRRISRRSGGVPIGLFTTRFLYTNFTLCGKQQAYRSCSGRDGLYSGQESKVLSFAGHG